MQAASRCQPAPSLLFFQNKGRETCSGDPFTSRTISRYIMTQVWLPANCCSEQGKTISSPLSGRRACTMPALCHPATGPGMCGRAWLLTRHPQRWQREEGQEKPPSSERLPPRQGGDPARAGGAGDGARLRALSCPGTAGMTVNRPSRHRADTALTPLLKMG